VEAEQSVTEVVSIVIPTYNRAPTVAACISRLRELEYPRAAYEVIVVDAGSSDDTWSRIQDADVCLRLPSRDANAARNAGIAAADGEIIALIDDDVVTPPGWLAALVDGAARWPHADCLGGPVKPVFPGGLPHLCSAHELAGSAFWNGDTERHVSEVWGGNMALRRSALARVGGFREGLAVQQEWEWEQRLLAAGGTIVYVPTAWLWHPVPASRLRLVPMVREFFRRGYVKARVGPPVSSARALRRERRWLGHALRTGCARGWAEAARSVGLLCGALVTQRSRRAGLCVQAQKLVDLAFGCEAPLDARARCSAKPLLEGRILVQPL
jgi:GT2 family glycosyltransferase